jgi:EmrB/QacA subfamily drug resistance transporter
VSAYALLFGGFLLLGGRIADIYGRRRLFIAGLITFTTASLVSGLAWNEGSLIAARAFQGLGAALITPAALSILMVTFAEGKERNAALGAWGGVGAFGAVAGVLLGGVLTDALSWQWIFFVNVPVGLAGLVLAPILLSESRDANVKSFDAPGAVLVTSSLVVLVYAITQANSYGWASIETIGLFTASVALMAGFLGWEARTSDPILPFSFFRLRTVVGANIVGLIMGTAMFAMFLMLTLYMQQVLHYSAMKTGVGYLAVAGTAIVWSGVAAQLVNRVGVKPVLVAGMAFLSAGLIYFTQVSVDGTYVGDLLPGFLLISVGLGFSFVPISIAALAGVPSSEAGLASGLMNTSQQIGGALGIAVLSAIATRQTGDAIASGSNQAVALTEGFQSAFMAAAGVALVGILVALVVVQRVDLDIAPPVEAEPEPALEAA